MYRIAVLTHPAKPVTTQYLLASFLPFYSFMLICCTKRATRICLFPCGFDFQLTTRIDTLEKTPWWLLTFGLVLSVLTALLLSALEVSGPALPSGTAGDNRAILPHTGSRRRGEGWGRAGGVLVRRKTMRCRAQNAD